MRAAAVLGLVGLLGCGAAGGFDAYVPGSPDAVNATVAGMIDRTYKVKIDCPDDDRDTGGSAVDLGDLNVVTAAHVVDDVDGCEIWLYTGDYPRMPAELVKVHNDVDIALLRGKRLMSLLPFAQPVLGLPLTAVGYPSGNLTVTTGVLASGEDSDGHVRITAPIYFGNSGGGAFDDHGSLAGVTVAVFMYRPGWSLMVPVSYVRDLLY